MLSSEETKDMLLAIATMFQEKRDELSKLDSLVGDGDHGISMARGAKEAYKNISLMSDHEPVNKYFQVYGRTLVQTIGGAIGPLFGMIFTEIGKCIKKDGLTANSYVEALESGMNKVMEFGGAKFNDKTMVDAMELAVKYAKKALEDNSDLQEIAIKAAEGAMIGVNNTIPMRAHRGRSKFLQEKSIGHQDAGATSYYYLLQRISDYMQGDTNYTPYNDDDVAAMKEKQGTKVRINKFINNPNDVVDEAVEGFVKAYGDSVKKLPNCNALVRKKLNRDAVSVIIGNGSGHEPACIGFIGENFLSGNAYGGIFASPDPFTIYNTIKATDMGKGVCVLISSHAGDILNSNMAIDMAEDDGVLVKGVVLYDDIASAPKSEPVSERRGSIGTIFSYKMTSSFAEEGDSLEKVIEFAEKVRDNSRSIAAAMTPGTSPVTGEKTFEIAEGEVIVGLGVHGEAALQSYQDASCSQIAEGMISRLVEDLPYKKGDEVVVIVSGMGGTTLMEQMIFYNEVEKYLSSKGIKSFKPLIGSFITTQEMGGIGLAICKVDTQMKNMWVKPTTAKFFPNL